MKERQTKTNRVCAIALASMLAACAIPAQAMYKCSTPSGTTFQQTPCENAKDAAPAYQPGGMPKGHAEIVPPATAPAVPAVEAVAPSAAAAEAPIDPQEINRAIVGSYPVRGMTIAQLQSALGTPDRINSGDYQGGYSEQRIYTKPQTRYYVYTDGVRVRSIQSSQIVDASPQQTSRSCPSPFDIKNEEVSANSITLTDAQRRAKLDHIQAMRECRS